MSEWTVNFSTSDHSYTTLDLNLPVRVESFVDYESLHAHIAIINLNSHYNDYDNDSTMFYKTFQSIIDDLVDQYALIKILSLRNVMWFTPTSKNISLHQET